MQANNKAQQAKPSEPPPAPAAVVSSSAQDLEILVPCPEEPQSSLYQAAGTEPPAGPSDPLTAQPLAGSQDLAASGFDPAEQTWSADGRAPGSTVAAQTGDHDGARVGQASDETAGNEECVVCWAANACVIFQPCGHLCTCACCAQLFLAGGLCPLCRQPVSTGIVLDLD